MFIVYYVTDKICHTTTKNPLHKKVKLVPIPLTKNIHGKVLMSHGFFCFCLRLQYLLNLL